ncbi:MAG: hypothetical protein ABW061_29515 [Polyangiaceae bacterium]
MIILRSASVALALTLTLGGLVACGSDAASDGGSSGAAGSASSGSAGKGGGGPTNNEPELTGTMSFSNGAKLDCKVSTQNFPASGEYSVLCEEDASNFRFVQVTFKDEASARTAQTLKFMKPFAFSPEDHPDTDAIAVSWTGTDGTLDSDDDSTGSAKVAKSGDHYAVTLSDVSVESTPTKATGTVTAVIDF